MDEERLSVDKKVGAGKDLLAITKDLIIIGLLVLLVVFPTTLNDVLVRAGFEEGSFAGLKWKKRVLKTDEDLKNANLEIGKLKRQLEAANNQLVLLKGQMRNPEEEKKIEAVVRNFDDILKDAAKSKQNVEKSIRDNRAFIKKAQTDTASDHGRFGVVFSGDRTVKEAKYEIRKAERAGIEDARIYQRRGSYRSVAVFQSRDEASAALATLRAINKDAYLVSMSSWCPESSKDATGLYRCNSS